MSLDLINPETNGPPRILIVDDNPSIHRDFDLVFADEAQNTELDADEQRIFGSEAKPNAVRHVYDVDHALSGLDGIEHIRRAFHENNPFQVAFVDIRMPGIDGVETIKRIWEVDARTQIVICTAYADYSQEDLAQLLGETDKLLVLKKPFDSIEVTQLARTLTEKWFLARQAALKMEEMELLVSRRTQKLLELQHQEFKEAQELDESKLRSLMKLIREMSGPLEKMIVSDQAHQKQQDEIQHKVRQLLQLIQRLPDFEKAKYPGVMESETPLVEDWELAESKMPLLLVVGSNAAIGSQINQILSEDYRLVEIDAAQTLDKARDLVPDLVILDLAAPEWEGIEICRRLKNAQLTNHIPIIVLTSDTSESHQVKVLEAGIDEYVVKPFSLPLLKARVENLLELRRKLRERIPFALPLRPRDMVTNQADAQFLQRIIAVIEQHLSDFEFDVDELARKVAVSRRQLFRKLKAVVNTTPKALIRSLRLKRAAQLLEESEMTVTEITYAVGFSDVKHFRNLFREQFGILPGQYTRRPGAPEIAAPPAK